jgi:hypothetical protein
VIPAGGNRGKSSGTTGGGLLNNPADIFCFGPRGERNMDAEHGDKKSSNFDTESRAKTLHRRLPLWELSPPKSTTWMFEALDIQAWTICGFTEQFENAEKSSLTRTLVMVFTKNRCTSPAQAPSLVAEKSR